MKPGGSDRILLAHGGGGQLSAEFIERFLLPRFGKGLGDLADAAECEVPAGRLCFTTDSYVVKPLFFNGGDIGRLAVCGTVNDLAVCGARPLAIALSLIIEEGFEFALLERILDSVAAAAVENGVAVVTGDTKTVEAGAADGIYLNTAGVGAKAEGVELGFGRIRPGDGVIVSGTIGDHGMAILSQREGIRFESRIKSDCAGVAGLALALVERAGAVKFMRDPTRGGLAATLNEIARAARLSVEINEADVPVSAAVLAAAGMLGLDVLNIANEGKLVAVVDAASASDCLDCLRSRPAGAEARIIGRVVEAHGVPVVEMTTKIGGRRIVQMPYGRDLPRIC
jgi:hydrogenase expression/formation protein HypE